MNKRPKEIYTNRSSQAVDFHHLPKGLESYRSSWALPHHPLLPLVGPWWRGVQHR